jgi:hypothetical protein
VSPIFALVLTPVPTPLQYPASDVTVSFSAEDALASWATKHGSDATAEKVLGPGARGAATHLQAVEKVCTPLALYRPVSGTIYTLSSVDSSIYSPNM